MVFPGRWIAKDDSRNLTARPLASTFGSHSQLTKNVCFNDLFLHQQEDDGTNYPGKTASGSSENVLGESAVSSRVCEWEMQKCDVGQEEKGSSGADSLCLSKGDAD